MLCHCIAGHLPRRDHNHQAKAWVCPAQQGGGVRVQPIWPAGSWCSLEVWFWTCGHLSPHGPWHPLPATAEAGSGGSTGMGCSNYRTQDSTALLFTVGPILYLKGANPSTILAASEMGRNWDPFHTAFKLQLFLVQTSTSTLPTLGLELELELQILFYSA